MISCIPEKPQNEQFTDSQWQAVHLTGTNILVSASAGSGKTTVLTRRIIEKLKKGVRVDQLLVCTFTDAATLEMKERIESAIKKEINAQIDLKNDALVDHLQEQLTLLPQAQISTIHAFCSKLIARHFEHIHMDPVFQMLTDETQISLMKESVYEMIVNEMSDDEDFMRLMFSYAAKRTDKKVAELIIQLYDFSRSKSAPDQWLDDLATIYDVTTIHESVLYRELLLPFIQQNVMDALTMIDEAIDTLAGEKVLDKLTQFLQEERQFYAVWLDKLEQFDTYDNVYQFVTQYEYARMIGKIKDSEDFQEAIDKAKGLRNASKKLVESVIDAVYFADEQTQIARLQSALGNIQTLARATKRFAQLYAQEKQADNLVDYSDLEHLALNILMPLQHDNTRKVSSVAQYYQNHFHEIMVDEYQDVNRLQESIIQAVSNGKNVFMVGDVKQSIYAFRLADPKLFLEKYHAYAKDNADGVRILLKENFRSRGSVIHATNLIFQQIMDEVLSGMNYDGDAMLVHGNTSFPNEEDSDVSVLIYENDDQDDTENDEVDSATEGEIHMVANHINRLISEGFDLANRKATYQDIVLLSPTKKNNVKIKEIFETYGIPVVIQESDSYFKRTEIMIMLSLLRVIDNPYQDIPLVSVLRSPLVDLDDSQLAAIRINDQTSDYYRALLRFVDDYRVGGVQQNAFHDALFEKVTVFIERLRRWRYMANKESIVALIWDIYDQTLFLDFVSGLPGGVQRQANLHALYDTAKAYEQTRFKGLFQFVQFIERMQERDKDIAQVPLLSQGENAVRVMTIHASKGLEFPIVYCMDLAKQFNLQDIKGDSIFTEEFGVGTYDFDIVKKWKYQTLAHTGMKWFKRRQLLAEEMRKLYVALTRAKEKLILVGRAKSRQHYFEQFDFLQDYPHLFLPQGKREKSSVTAFDWISMALVRHEHHRNDFVTHAYIPNSLKNHPAKFHYEFYNVSDFKVNPTSAVQKESVVSSKSQQGILEQTLSNLTGDYPFENTTKTTSYQSVSELKRLYEDPILMELDNPTYRFVTNDFAKPKFMVSQEVVTPAMIGTATHVLLQSMDMTQEVTMASLQSQANQLVAKGVLQQNVADKINYFNVLRFFGTDLASDMKKHAHTLRVEVPFSLLVQGKELFSQLEENQSDVLVHGIVDGYYETPDGVVLFDYKTDYVGGNITQDDVVSRYRVQLTTYVRALEASLGKKVTHAYIVILSTGNVVDVLTDVSE
ncbi:helicase-exonuclease AddAB subunit AddA [Carnobacteriaceae bacterium zg-ZUI252]|nr:helicase-exonuclease AddAB subunit AddA [Carnobacteriaceae bacterium zg-ZUI252]